MTVQWELTIEMDFSVFLLLKAGIFWPLSKMQNIEGTHVPSQRSHPHKSKMPKKVISKPHLSFIHFSCHPLEQLLTQCEKERKGSGMKNAQSCCDLISNWVVQPRDEHLLRVKPYQHRFISCVLPENVHGQTPRDLNMKQGDINSQVAVHCSFIAVFTVVTIRIAPFALSKGSGTLT